MPAKRAVGVDLSAWTLSEHLEEIRGKVHLKERDAKAFYESSEVKKIHHEEQIAKLRTENKDKRISLAKSINGDEQVIRSVFLHRREELLSMHRATVNHAIKTMDQKVCESSKELNALQHLTNEKRTRLDALKVRLSKMREIEATDYDVDRERAIRRHQNEMDKAGIKYEAARNISRRYEQIMAHMQEECRNYPARLDLLEHVLRQARSELTELKQMKDKAVASSEEARKEQHIMEREMYQAKRARDQQLTETRKEVERRREPADRTEKRARVTILSDTSDSKATKLQLQKAERQEKILRLEDGFEKIKRAIKVSDIEGIVFRVSNQGNTRERLRQQEKEKLSLRGKLTEELEKMRNVFEELKFTSQRQMARGRKLVEEMQEYARNEEKRSDRSVETMQRKERLLLDLQSGIATLFEKLKDVKLKPPYHNYTKGDPMDDLTNCARKLDVLLTELGLKKGVEVKTPKLDSKKLHEYLESRLPMENVRIRLDIEDVSDGDGFHLDYDQENEGLLHREDVKRIGRELLDSKLKPKKKKARKARAS